LLVKSWREREGNGVLPEKSGKKRAWGAYKEKGKRSSNWVVKGGRGGQTGPDSKKPNLGYRLKKRN